MRRAALAVALGSLLFGAPASAQVAPAPEPALRPAGDSGFPARAYTFTVPDRSGLRAADLQVTENGEPVADLTVTAADRGRRGDFGVVLVIDASKSMRGGAIRGAVEAARTLASRRTDAQQLGIIAFNRTPTVVLPLTDDRAAIDRALRRAPALAPKTHMFDAVDTALGLLRRERIAAGTIVLLSDGADSGSRITQAAVARKARRANVALYTVGLRTGVTGGGQLQELAAAGRGRYAAASSAADLRRIYRGLGATLAGDSLLRYRSAAEPGQEVTVAVRVAGVRGAASHAYVIPGGASYVQVRDSFWTSGLGVGLTALACALLVLFGLAVVLLRRVRGPSLRERVHGFVTPSGTVSPTFDVAQTLELRGGTDRGRQRAGWVLALEQDLDVGRLGWTVQRVVVATTVGTVLALVLFAAVTGIPLVGLLMAAAVPFGVRAFVRVKVERQRAQFTEQLPDLLQGSASAVRAGHGLVAALTMIAETSPEPTRTEFLRVVADEGLGVPLEEALNGVRDRMANREILQLSLVAQIQREAGGNMAEVLDRVTETLRQKGELRRMVRALTAQGRMSRWVVTLLPVGLLLFVSVLNPDYVNPLFTEPLGLLMLAVATVIMAAGSMVIGKIVNFRV